MDTSKIEKRLQETAEMHGTTWNSTKMVGVTGVQTNWESGRKFFHALIVPLFPRDTNIRPFTTIEEALGFLEEQSYRLRREGWDKVYLNTENGSLGAQK